jgi:type VI secretion system secreted protein Hcp
MAVDMFLKLDDVKGESADDKHKDEIDVLSWSWGITQSATGHVGGGSGSGKANVSDIHITKYIDSSSHKLLKSTATGTHFKEALLTIRKAGEKPLEYIKITMKEVLISSISCGGSGGEDKLTENITLNFADVDYVYTPQKPDGSGGSALPFGYHIAQNKAR